MGRERQGSLCVALDASSPKPWQAAAHVKTLVDVQGVLLDALKLLHVLVWVAHTDCVRHMGQGSVSLMRLPVLQLGSSNTLRFLVILACQSGHGQKTFTLPPTPAQHPATSNSRVQTKDSDALQHRL